MSDLIRFAERVIIIMLSCAVVYRMLPTLSFHPQVVLVLLCELSTVFFLLIQRRGTWSSDFYPTFIAFVGCGAALSIMPNGATLAPNWLTTPIIVSGTAVALAAKLSLRRSFGLIPANRGVKKGGAYRFVHHPMYAGYVLTHVGFLMVYFSAWNLAVYAVAWVLLYLRAIEEERFLLTDPDYVAYAQTVRARIVPGLI